MEVILDVVESQRIKDLARVTERISNDYLTDRSDVQTDFIKRQFFKLEKDVTKLDLLNISYSVPYAICTKVSDYVGTPYFSFPIDIDEGVMTLINGGYSVLVCRIVNDKQVVDNIEAERYVKLADGTEIIFTYYSVSDSTNTGILHYILKQSYFNGRISNRLYLKTNGDDIIGGLQGQEVPLSTLDETKALSGDEDLGITYNPIVVIHNRKLNGSKYGASEIALVESLITAIEIQKVNIIDQFLKHLQAKLALPTRQLVKDKDGRVDVRALEAFPLESGDPIPTYIVNSNPLMKESFTDIEHCLRQIAAITGVPAEFLGLKDVGGAESGDAKAIRISMFLKKVERIREKFSTALIQVHKIFKDFGLKDLGEPFVSWDEVFPIDGLQVANEMGTALDNRLISRVRAIMKYQNLDEEEARKELELINSENADPLDTNTLPNE